MQKPSGYDNVQAREFGIIYPKADAYVFGIRKVEDTTSSTGKSMTVLTLDIARGRFKNFYFDQTKKSTDGKERYLKMYVLADDDPKSVAKLKGIIAAIEKSNPGFVFDWNNQSLVGKLVGGMLQEKQYYKSNGTIGETVKISYLCSIESAESGELRIPPKEMVALSQQPYIPGAGVNEFGGSGGFDDSPTPTDEDLPF